MKFIRFLIPLFIILFLTCGKENDNTDKIRTLSDEGKSFLSSGEYQSAETKFEEILNIDPNNCDGIYGLFLSKLMIFLDQVFSELGSVTGLVPQANEIDTIAGSVLETFLSNFNDIESYISLAEANNCSFELEKLNISFAGIEIRGEWDVNEANLIGALFDIIEAVMEFLMGFDLSVETGPLLSALTDGTMKLSTDDIVGTLRGLGFIFETSPDFLKWHPQSERRDYFDKSAGEFSSAFRRLNGLLDIFSEQDENPQDDIIGWIDGDGDGAVSSGDSIVLNVYDADTGEPVVDLSQYSSLLLPIVGSMLPDWKSKLQRIEDAFAFRLAPGERVSLNDLLLGFGSLLGIPDVFEFDILALYKGSDYSGGALKPLRELMPYIYDDDSKPETPKVFLVEGETYTVPPSGTESYLFQGDAEHFNVGFDWNPDDASTDNTGRIKKDCAIPQEKGIEIGTDNNGVPVYLPLIYSGFPDPSFNGAIYADSGGSCGDHSGFSKATVYSLNKGFNRVLIGIGQLLGTGLPF